MMEPKERKNSAVYFEERIRYLEERERFTLEALDTAASLGNFQQSINQLHSNVVILEETKKRIDSLIPFQATAFYLVDENSQDFIPCHIEPSDCKTLIQDEVEFLVESGSFAWALRERKPLIVAAKSYDRQILIHLMSTTSRIRGMFIGLLEKEKINISSISLSLLSIILLNSSNTLESYELYGMIRDIRHNLERTENYRLLFEAAPDGVEVLDIRGHLIDCNQAQAELLGYGRKDLIGRHTSEFFSSSTKATFGAKCPSLKEEGWAEGEVELVHRDGALIPIWRKAKAVYDEKSRFVGAVVYNRDLSIQKEREAKKRELEAQLQRSQKMEVLGTLAGGVAHDLNNVLGVLFAYSELLLLKMGPDNHLRSYAENILASGKKAAASIQDLLTLTRRGVSVSETVNINAIISEFLKTPVFQTMAASYHPLVTFRVELSPELMNLKGAAMQLEKALMNLLSNAAEAISGPGEVLIRTENRYLEKPLTDPDVIPAGEYAVLTISDTGDGISEADIDKIFEPFYTKKVMGRSGTGLGLTTVWGIVKDHGGHIDVKSAAGKGTAFHLSFPATREEVKPRRDHIPPMDYRGQGESILVVDDLASQRDIATRILNDLGYRVHTVASGEEAVAYLQNHVVDLLVLDMIMEPGIDGLETFERIRRLKPQQKAILVSGYSETGRVKKAQILGAGPYVPKPYLMEKIGLAIRTELER